MNRLFIYLLCILFLYSCKEDQSLKFCEGKSHDGNEINCGEVFSIGDLSISILSKELFEVDKLDVNIYEKKRLRKEFVETKSIKVKPDKDKIISDVKLYKEGTYLIEVLGKESAVIASGEVKIVDLY